ncbi:MAG: PilZ domain-containing protein [Chloroherpetonaceae bacterium]|nr:PilZ domain-containing protein [Chthonomonadaceae bacterium]MDW8207879.1 PilZ domain-containing protein [Chloroherpetonaceae bacterium]
MLTVSTGRQTVDLAILDGNDVSPRTVQATLDHLDGETGVLRLHLDTDALPTRGARVQFHIGDGYHRYQVRGMVVERRPQNPDASVEGAPAILVQLWECVPAVERRRSPRCQTRFLVRYLPLSAEGTPVSAGSEWLRAWCVDLGVGGMRLRLARPLCVPDRLILRFSLPGSGASAPRKLRRTFQLKGRVLRCTACGPRGSHVEMAISFQGISVQDGLALSAYVGA